MVHPIKSYYTILYPHKISSVRSFVFIISPQDTPFDPFFLSHKIPDFRIGHGSIPINTIFSGMNIHKSQLFWCSLGGTAFWPIPNSSTRGFCLTHWSLSFLQPLREQRCAAIALKAPGSTMFTIQHHQFRMGSQKPQIWLIYGIILVNIWDNPG